MQRDKWANVAKRVKRAERNTNSIEKPQIIIKYSSRNQQKKRNDEEKRQKLYIIMQDDI